MRMPVGRAPGFQFLRMRVRPVAPQRTWRRDTGGMQKPNTTIKLLSLTTSATKHFGRSPRIGTRVHSTPRLQREKWVAAKTGSAGVIVEVAATPPLPPAAAGAAPARKAHKDGRAACALCFAKNTPAGRTSGFRFLFCPIVHRIFALVFRKGTL